MKNKYYYSLILSVSLLLSGLSFGQDFINANYDYGMKATNVGANDMSQVYNTWKNKYVAACGNNQFRVKFDDPNFTVSEGIAYGMLITVYANDRTVFDGLWRYYKQHANGNGVMNWKIQQCNNVNGQNGATDAELDAASALMVADFRWGNSGAINYESEARRLINIIKIHEVEGGSNVLKPGDAWGGSNTTNPSYFATGYFRNFGEYTNDSGFWNAVADKSYQIINNNLSQNNAVYNLVSDWTRADGNYSSEVGWATHQGKAYFYDAARTPWRAAIDYVWYGNNDALNYTNLCNDFVNSKGGIGNIYPGYFKDGTPITTVYKDPTFTGAYALAAMASGNQSYVNNAYNVLKSQPIESYFGSTLRVIYMYGMSGNLFNPLSATLSNDEVISKEGIKLFPNPVKDTLNINLKSSSSNKVSILDMNGRKIYSTVYNGATINMDVSKYSSGVYFVKVNNSVLKFIKL